LKSYADKPSGTVLTRAAENGNLDLVKVLLDRKADVNAPAGFPLQIAAGEGHLEVVQELLQHGADVNACTTNEAFPPGTALQAACEAGKVEIVELLLQRNANPNLGGGPHAYPIVAAAERGEAQLVEALIKAKAEVNVFGGFDGIHRSTPLINAAAYLPKESLELLLQAGADINLSDTEGDTALIVAAAKGDKDCVACLLAQGADIMHSNDSDLNAIQAALSEKYRELVGGSRNDDCVKLLVNHASRILGAVKTAMDSGNSTVIDIVKIVGISEEILDAAKSEKQRRGSDASFVANDESHFRTGSLDNKEDQETGEKGTTAETADMPESPLDKQNMDGEQNDAPDEAEVEILPQEPNSSFTTVRPTTQWAPTENSTQSRPPPPGQMSFGREIPPVVPTSLHSSTAYPAPLAYAGSAYQQAPPAPPPKNPSYFPETTAYEPYQAYPGPPPAQDITSYESWQPGPSTYQASPPRVQYQSPPPEQRYSTRPSSGYQSYPREGQMQYQPYQPGRPSGPVQGQWQGNQSQNMYDGAAYGDEDDEGDEAETEPRWEIFNSNRKGTC
jgi:ankyrin repeat protein